MCASQMHTYYHLEFQQSPTSISIIKNLQDEVCNTAYWIYKSQKHTGRPISAATELLPPTLPHLDHFQQQEIYLGGVSTAKNRQT